jgi:hypothetical protein
MAHKGIYQGQPSFRAHAVTVGADGVARSLCEGRQVTVVPGTFNPMADRACQRCCTTIRLLGDRPRISIS